MSSSVISDGGRPIGKPVASRATHGADETAGGTTSERGLSVADHLTLFAIGLVVVLVSLPRLRRFAVRENENDAIHALRLLSADAAEKPEVLGEGGLGALLAASAGHRDRLADVELLEDGRLRRHGYLFDALEGEPGRWLLRAWPWEHGRTGLGAFLATDATVLGCENKNGRFSGPSSPPALPSLDGAHAAVAPVAPVEWLVVRR